MKIRAGFVSNSSSTSFLIITNEDLNRADFLELMGIAEDSPVADLFEELYQDVLERSKKVDFKRIDKSVPISKLFDTEESRLSDRMLEKIKEARRRGLRAYYGWLDSESTMIQSFFCTDSFEVENEKIYFNGLECVW